MAWVQRDMRNSRPKGIKKKQSFFLTREKQRKCRLITADTMKILVNGKVPAV
jgi:hypothetical protein